MKKKKTSERFSKRVLSALRKTTNKICSNMEHRVFFDKVSLMRMRQKEYFKTRSNAALEASKALEREIDNEIERVNKIIGISPSKSEPIQGNLFDNASK